MDKDGGTGNMANLVMNSHPHLQDDGGAKPPSKFEMFKAYSNGLRPMRPGSAPILKGGPLSPSKKPKAVEVKVPVREVEPEDWFRKLVKEPKRQINLENIATYQEPNDFDTRDESQHAGEEHESSKKVQIKVMRPTSPRSLNIMLRLGIEPTELAYHPLAYFEQKNVSQKVAKQQFEFFEKRRKARMNEALQEYYDEQERARHNQKAKLENFGLDPNAGTKKKKKAGDDEGTKALLEEEKKRNEVLKLKAKKDLEKMMSHEIQRKEQLEKMEQKMENVRERIRKQEEEREAKQEAFRQKQFEIDMRRKVQEEEQRQLEKKYAQKEFEEDQRVKAIEKAREEEAKRLAKEREENRKAKARESRRRTENILRQQQALVEQARLAREAKEKARLVRLGEEAKEKAEINRQEREKAEARLAKGLAKAEKEEAERKVKLLARMDAAQKRNEELERQKQIAIKQHQEQVKQLNAKREETLENARQAELAWQDNLALHLNRRADKTDVYMKRKAFSARARMMDRALVHMDKDLRVKANERAQAFARHAGLQRIKRSNEKTQMHLKQREDVINMRRFTNIQAAMTKQKLKEDLDRMQAAQMRAFNPAKRDNDDDGDGGA
ncbi:hypothetical protein NFJ02_17g27450 [Pycnococcus provasolii]